MKTSTIKNCEKCNKEDTTQQGLCPSCEFKQLQEENEDLRDSIDGYLPNDKAENSRIWELIGELIQNELDQEKECNQ